MVRAHIRLDKTNDYIEFVQLINSDGTTDKYVLTDDTGAFVVDARSLMGVIYMAIDHNDSTYLVNKTHDGVFPKGIDNFRKL